MRVEHVPATMAHVDAIAANPRQADVDEMWASNRVSVREAMMVGMKRSRAMVAEVDGVAVCMFGITPHNLMLGQGVPWLVGSAAMESLSASRELLRRSRAFMADAKRDYQLLFNAVDDRNEASKRWLAWLGFTLLAPAPMGADGLPFRPFYWSA